MVKLYINKELGRDMLPLAPNKQIQDPGLPCDSCGRKDGEVWIGCGIHMDFGACGNNDCWHKHILTFPNEGCYSVEL